MNQRIYDNQSRLSDVIFAEGAINYEEGKYHKDGDEVTFRGDFDKITISAGDMQSFAESPRRPNYHFGDFITGSAVRTDAAKIFENIRKTACYHLQHPPTLLT